MIDEFAARFVYFYTGYLLAPRIFALAREVQAPPEAALAGLTVWGLINGAAGVQRACRTAVRVARRSAWSAPSRWSRSRP